MSAKEFKTVPYTLKDFKADSFYKYPQWLFHDPALKELSKAAKSLYMYFLNMNGLSFRHADEYTDAQGEIYFICSRAAIRELLNCGYNQPRIYVEQLKRYGLLREKRTGCNRPNKLYLLRPETTYVKPKKPEKDPAKPQNHRMHSFGASGYTLSVRPDTPFECTLLLDKDLQDSDLLSVSRPEPTPEADGLDETEKKIKENIEYDELCATHPHDIPFIDELVAVALDVIFTENRTVRIDKEDKPRALVARQLLRLNQDDIIRCVEQFRRVREKIVNKPAYLRAMLYNAKLETDAHYTNAVASDRAGGAL